MIRTAWPSVVDVVSYMVGAGMVDSVLTEAQHHLDFQLAVDSAVAELEDATDYSPFKMDETDVVRKYTPTGTKLLQFRAGLLSLTSLVVGVSSGFSGTTLTVDEDFWLGPENAAVKRMPYLWAEFRRPLHGIERSIWVTGKWGRWTSIDPRAYEAVIVKAASKLATQVAAEATGGMISWTEADSTSEKYGADGAFGPQIAAWDKRFLDIVSSSDLRRLMVN